MSHDTQTMLMGAIVGVLATILAQLVVAEIKRYRRVRAYPTIIGPACRLIEVKPGAAPPAPTTTPPE